MKTLRGKSRARVCRVWRRETRETRGAGRTVSFDHLMFLEEALLSTCRPGDRLGCGESRRPITHRPHKASAFALVHDLSKESGQLVLETPLDRQKRQAEVYTPVHRRTYNRASSN